jgi:hypothetical protein
MARQRIYLEQERLATEKWKQECQSSPNNGQQ